MLGALLAFASAAFFGLNSATVRRGVLKSTVLQGMAVTVPLGVPFFAAFALFMGGFAAMADWQLSTLAWMALAGVVHFVVGRYGNYRATQELGAALSAPVQQLSIVFALFLALVFLDEDITGLNIIGILLIMFGPALVLKRGKSAKPSRDRSGFKPNYSSGLFWGLVCACGYGSSPLFIALALRTDGSIADSVAGVFVSYCAATIVVSGLVFAAGGRSYLTALDRTSLLWFVLSALFVAISQLMRYMALALVPVSVVVPIQRLSVVFRLIFGAILNRDHEIIDRWVIAVILVSLIGALALTLDTAFVLSLIPLPDLIASILAWRLGAW